jgi:hypothetical protein
MRRRRILVQRSLLPLLTAGLAISWIAGCGDGQIKRYPVTGSVTVDGKPADGAMVIFCPGDDAPAEVRRTRPFGFTGPDGHFLLTTLTKADGSPAGEYKVLIQWPAASGGDSRDGGRSIGPDRLNGRYMSLDRCEIKVKIGDGPNDLPPFELKSK